MATAPIPDDEHRRLAALVKMAILDTPREANFDRIAEMTKRFFNAPIVLISLIDQHRQWFKSYYGVSELQMPRATAFCSYTILADTPLIIEDATKDPRFFDHPWVKEDPKIVFYAGKSVQSPDGLNVGTLCLIDTKPRPWHPTDAALLNDLAHLIEQAFLIRTLEANDSNWQKLFDNMTVGFATHEVIKDKDGKVIDYRFLEMNTAYQKLTRLDAKSAVGKTVLEILPKTEPYWIEKFGGVAVSGISIDYENYSRELGHWYSVRAYSPAPDKFAVLVSDITNIKHAESELLLLSEELQKKVQLLEESDRNLRQLNEELELRVEKRTKSLEEANLSLAMTLKELEITKNELVTSEKLASLGALVAGISHELNTPIGNALTISTSVEDAFEKLASHLSDEKVKKSDIKSLVNAGLEMSALMTKCLNQSVNMIQSFKRISVDQSSHGRRTFSLTELINDVVATTTFGLPRLGKKIEIFNRTPFAICCDGYPGALSQVITNLIQNAVVHGFDDHNEGIILIDATVIDNSVTLTIKDNGIGMSAEVVRHAFDPFFTTKLGQGGSGLGLTICHRLMTTNLGGHIEVDSKPGMGTVFTLAFPIIAADDQE